jgi:hypothetical protein
MRLDVVRSELICVDNPLPGARVMRRRATTAVATRGEPRCSTTQREGTTELNILQNGDHSHKQDGDELTPIPAYDGIVSLRRRREGNLACYLANPYAQFQSCRNLLSAFVLPTTDDDLQVYSTATTAATHAHDLQCIDDAVGLQSSSNEK